MITHFIQNKFKIFFVSLIVLMSFSFITTANAIEEEVEINFFSQKGCQHCVNADIFLDEVKDIRNIKITKYEITGREDFNLFSKLTTHFKLPKATPLIVIGNEAISGFGEAETTGQEILVLIDKYKDYPNYTLNDVLENKDYEPLPTTEYQPLKVKVPLLGVVDVKKYSLFTLSSILGFVDGFNPCAMWVLVMFLTVLIQVGDKKKMFIVAGIFIFAEAVMYYLILNVWYTAWNFIGLNQIITPLVGGIAIVCGIYFLYKFFKYRGECKVVGFETRQKTKNKIFSLTNAPLTIFSIFAILGLAFSVNIIEFACSIGIPQTFTKVLDLNNLTWMSKQFFMLIYIIFYMIDDLIIFGIALYSFEKIGITHKYSQISTLIGGVLMIILGFLLLFYPNALIVF